MCADARYPPFRESSFDLVLCINALPHLAPIHETLRRLIACLRPGGLLSVGHLMGSEVLNAFHASLGGPVAEDLLPDACDLAGTLASLGVQVVCQEEDPGWYLVQARKPAR